MYDNLRDVEFRLNRTVVEYNNNYAYVAGIDFGGGDGVEGCKLKLEQDGNEILVPLSAPELKIRNIRTGYYSLAGKLVFITRRANRTYRQGLRHDNLKFNGIAGGGYWEQFLATVRHGRGVVGKVDYKVLDNNYAVQGSNLLYRGREVGAYIDNKAYLTNGMQFLAEMLEQTLERKDAKGVV